MTLKALIQKLDYLERSLEDKSYTPADVKWLIEKLGEQAQANQDLLEVVASAYQNGFKDAQCGEDWRDDPVETGRITFGRFQIESQRTLPVPPSHEKDLAFQRLIVAIGLAGEVGEAIDLIKKVEGHGHPLDRERLAGELGDVLWYIASLCSYYRLDMDRVATGNIAKLRKRYPDGFSQEASVNRAI